MDELVRGQSPGRWAGWRGTQRGGVNDAFPLPVAWSANGGFRWKVDVAGRGNSSPVVWGDRIFLTSTEGTDDQASLVVLCFDRASGELRWRADAATPEGATHEKNGYASATVATDGEAVLASFGSAGLFCYDIDGNLQWRAALGEMEHVWGTASSPVLCGNLVIQLCDRQQDSFLVALDKSTGEIVWRRPRVSYGGWSTPVLVEARVADNETHTELVVNGTGSDDPDGGLVTAYDPLSGDELWQVRGTTDIVCPTIIDAGGLLISTSGRNGPILAIRGGGSGDVTDSHVVWQHRRGGPYVPTGVAYRKRLYLVSDGGVAASYDLTTGEKIWQQRLRGAFTSSLVAGDGKVYAISESGTVHILAASDEFEVLAEIALDERCLATPALVEGELILRTASQLYCVAAPVESESASEASQPTEPADALAEVDAQPSDEGDEIAIVPADATPFESDSTTDQPEPTISRE